MLIDSLFSKSIHLLDEKDIVSFFSKIQIENDKLEFKSFKSVLSNEKNYLPKIIQTICGFLNTDGGVLIWGAPEGKPGEGKEKVFTGKLSPVVITYEKDRLVNKVISVINPTPNRISYAAIPISGGGYVYIFEVAASDFAPHQVFGTYYMRLDGQTKFAPHQYVDALVKKIRIPRLSMEFHFGAIHRVNDIVYLCFSISIINKSHFINERNVSLALNTFACILKEGDPFKDPETETNLNLQIADILYYGKPIRTYFILITTLFKGNGKRRIPIAAELLGEQSPILHSYYSIEIEFTEYLQPKYSILTMTENEYRTEKYAEEIIHYNKAIIDFFEADFINSETFKSLEKWESN